jgi:hypothetical protein
LHETNALTLQFKRMALDLQEQVTRSREVIAESRALILVVNQLLERSRAGLPACAPPEPTEGAGV